MSHRPPQRLLASLQTNSDVLLRLTTDLRWLLPDYQANVNISSHRFGCALHAAGEYGTLDAVRLMLGNGADIDARDDATPLLQAAGAGDADIASLPPGHGADPSACDKVRNTAGKEEPWTVGGRCIYKGRSYGMADGHLSTYSLALPRRPRNQPVVRGSL